MSLLTILLLVLVLAILFGAMGPSWQPGLGYYSWSPVAVVLVILVVLYLLGYIR
jgi:sterol desaturase/sphingolipid hydroxylase (fatty acid hydroxylase superfamily)